MFVPLCMDLSTDTLDRLLAYKPGGIHRLVAQDSLLLRDTAEYLQRKASLPLLLTGDLEFGMLGSLGDRGSCYQTQLGSAATEDSTGAVERMARIAAREGHAMGFNWSFSPVVDINYNFRSSVTATRSFGSNGETVKTLGSAYIAALQAEGMAACAKHWPGDGVDERDQHLVTTHNTMSMAEWEASYGTVYRAMIESGVLSVMSAHITLGAWDRVCDPTVGAEGVLPASISQNLNKRLLRETLGFNGVIISDATGMAGLTSQGGRPDIVPRVINGGCDMFLFSVDDDEDIDILREAVAQGTIPHERVEEAVLRILALKARLGLHKPGAATTSIPTKEEAEAVLGCAEHTRWSTEAAASSITIVKDTANLLPVQPATHRRVLLIESTPPGIFAPQEATPFGTYLEDAGFDVARMDEETYPSPLLHDLVIYLMNEQRFFGKGSFFASWPDLHHGTMKSMMRTWPEIPTVMISLGNPYHLYDAPRVGTYINAYSAIDPVLRSLVDLITGKAPFRGTSPVDPFCGLADAHL